MKRKIQIQTGKILKILTLLTVVFLAHGCGYKFVGGGQLPNGIKTVAVVVFENMTGETGLESTLTRYVNYELTRNGAKVTADQSKADAVITGVIRSATVETVSYRGDQISVENRVTVVASASLKNNDGKVIWHADRMTERETYKASSDNSAAISNKKSALSTLCKKMAESFYNRMTEDF